MKIDQNTNQTWNKIYSNKASEEEDKYFLERKKKSIQWKRIREIVLKKFGSFKNVKSIELGAGQGTFSLLFALEGADVSVLDYSENALEASKLLFKRNNAEAKFILMNALKLDESLFNKFDISMSFGTAEHFKDKERTDFINNHLLVLKDNGLSLVDVPNKHNLIYMLWKFLSQSFGKWKFGEEYPFTRKELKNIGKLLNANTEIVGGYLFSSHFIIKTRLMKLLGIKRDINNIKSEIGTPLDKYFSPSIMGIYNKRV